MSEIKAGFLESGLRFNLGGGKAMNGLDYGYGIGEPMTAEQRRLQRKIAARNNPAPTRPATSDEALILEMCRLHDREEAAMIGLPDPWADVFEDGGEEYRTFREDRMAAMALAFAVVKERFEQRVSERVSRAFCRGYNQAVSDMRP